LYKPKLDHDNYSNDKKGINIFENIINEKEIPNQNNLNKEINLLKNINLIV